MRPESVGRIKFKVAEKSFFSSEVSDDAEAKARCESSLTEIKKVPPVPDLDFTLEEEFRIYELLVRKENLLDGIFEISLQIPNFLGIWKEFLLSQCFGKLMTEDWRKCMINKNDTIIYNLMTGGSLWQSLDMFKEFTYVDQIVKIETMGFSIIVLHIFNR